MSQVVPRSQTANSVANKLRIGDEAVHAWYRFVLSFPPHLVREYLTRFGIDSGQRVLDPFCGTGTTLVECKKLGIPSVGTEVAPVAHLAAQVKVDWSPSPDGLLEHAREVAKAATAQLEAEGLDDTPLLSGAQQSAHSLRQLPPESYKLLINDSISPLPLHKTLVLLDCLERRRDDRYHQHELLALAKVLPTSIGNLRFGPEVGAGPKKDDVGAVSLWLQEVRRMADDLRHVRERDAVPSVVQRTDARELMETLEAKSIDAVITSPPYPNEKDYTRTTRLETVILGYIRNRRELQALKRQLLRSNTRNVYKGDADDEWVRAYPSVQQVAEEIEARRIELGKTSGFERQYANVVRLYFGGMARHLAALRPALRPGAQLAYVVGDQASYLRVMVRTGKLLAEIAQSLGYELVSTDLFRTRVATVTKEQLHEEVLVLRWPGR